MTRIRSTDGRAYPIGELVLWAILATVLINPMRETPFGDDWAYARMVRTYVDTGAQTADAWVAANPIAQIVWGAVWASVLGVSFSTLRLSTLALAVVGVGSFYLLARDHGLRPREAAMLSLVLIASPVFLGLSFTFMTDVPFVSLLLLTVLLYSRALQRGRTATFVAAALVGSATILTRQFGAVMIPAVALTSMYAPSRTRARALLSLLLPVVATGYQLWLGTAHANWTAVRLVHDQREHLNSGAVGEALWRSAAVLVYLAGFTLPLAVALIGRWRANRSCRLEAAIGLLIVVTIAAGAMWYGHPFVLPLMPWNLDVLAQWPLAARIALTAIAVLTAAFMGGCLWRRYASAQLATSERLLDATAAIYLLSQLVFAQFGDEYLLPLVPYVLIVVGRDLWLGRPMVSFGLLRAATVAMLLVSALHHRSLLSLNEAVWTGAEIATQHGAKPEHVSASWEWDAYHGSFDRFIASGTGQSASPSLRVALADYFTRWSSHTATHAQFMAWALDQPPDVDSGLTVLATVPYRDVFFRQKAVYVLSRQPIDHAAGSRP